jgi:hypothetical protein
MASDNLCLRLYRATNPASDNEPSDVEEMHIGDSYASVFCDLEHGLSPAEIMG